MKQQGNDEQKGMKKKGFLMQEEMEMLDMKRRCEVIQEKLRMLSCIAVNEGSVREIKSVFLEEGKNGSDGGNNNNNNNNNGDCSSRGVVNGNNINDNNNNNGGCCSSSEEDNLSDLADELVEVFELDKKDKTMEGNDNDGNDGMGLIVKECESENECGDDKGETLVVNDNKQDKVIDNNNNNITTSNKQQHLHQPLLIQEQPSHNIIEITSTPHFTSSISIVSQLSTTIPANPPKQQQQQPVQPELPPDDDTIIKTILETAKITESSPTIPQPTQSHTDNPSPDKKKVTFDPTRTFIIEYNENELITHLSVFNADYQPMKYKPKVVKNYKQITKNGVKPCINPEYTKYLKLNVKTMPKLVGGNNVVNANKKGNTCNSSRNLSSKKIGGVIKNETFTNIKRNINLNNTSTNTNTNGKINKTNNAMNTSMTITKQQMKGQSKGNAVHMDKTTNNNVGNSNSNSSKKVNKPVINKNEHNKDVNNNNNNKHKEQNIMTPIYEEVIDNDDIYQSTRHYSL